MSATTEAAPTTSASSEAPVLTDKEVRAALVKLQSVKGKDAAMAVLGKFTPENQRTIGGIPLPKYAEIVAACKAAEAA